MNHEANIALLCSEEGETWVVPYTVKAKLFKFKEFPGMVFMFHRPYSERKGRCSTHGMVIAEYETGFIITSTRTRGTMKGVVRKARERITSMGYGVFQQKIQRIKDKYGTVNDRASCPRIAKNIY